MKTTKNMKILGSILMMLILIVSVAGCSSPKPAAETPPVVTTPAEPAGKIVVGSKPFTEGYLLSEILVQMLQAHTDLEVVKQFGIAGGTSNIHPAMVKGDIDMYPEYTGTGWLFVLKQKPISDGEKLFDEVKKSYEKDFQITWGPKFGFNNTFTLAVSAADAEKYSLKTFSDLAKVSDQFTFGAEFDFYERDDGYDALVKTYGFKFKEARDMDINLKYQAISSKEVSVINAFSTDGPIKKYNLVILEDDLNFFPIYDAAPILRQETLDKYPQIADVMEMLSGEISEAEMIEMNYKVDEEKMDYEDVAKEFLEKKGLLQ
jgi:glycine betaine/choline ABC-type transport system substrate-binding protein